MSDVAQTAPAAERINNAGDMVRRMATAETPEEVWRDAIDLNLSSAFYCCQEAIAPMAAQGWGRIINISSVGARTGGGAGSIPYHAAKAALLTLTKGLAKELALNGVTVNSVAPGIIETPSTSGIRIRNCGPSGSAALFRCSGPASPPTSPKRSRSSPRRTPPTSRVRPWT